VSFESKSSSAEGSMEAFYVELFKSAARTDAVQRIKTANVLGRIFRHPAVSYGLGTAALGAGLPVAYGLGKQRAIEDAQRAGGPAPPVYPHPEDVYSGPSAYGGYADQGSYPDQGGGFGQGGYPGQGGFPDQGDPVGFLPDDVLYGLGIDALMDGLY